MAKKKPPNGGPAADLRRRAEELLRKAPRDIADLPPHDVQSLVQELQVHQVELEVQNEELRAAQFELEQSRDRFAELYDFAPVGYVSLDEGGVVVEANLRAASMLGAERARLVGRLLAEFVAPQSQDAFYLHQRAVFSGSKKQVCELEMRTAQGASLFVRMESVAPPEMNHRGPICQTALVDISQKREAEVWRIEAERMRRMVEHLPAGAVYVENDRIEMNRAAERITGYRRDELLTREQWFATLFGSRLPDVRAVYGKARAAAFRETLVLTITRKDGRERTIEFVAHVFDDHEVWLIHDVTERLEAERALRESEQRLRAILENAAMAIITIDTAGVIQDANPVAERMFGYDHDEMLGRKVNVLMPSPYAEQHDGYLARYLQTEVPRIMGAIRELIARRKDGSTFPIELTVSEVGRLGLFTGIVRDVSERRELQRQVLLTAQEEQRRIGQELHDDLQQQLAGLGLLAQSVGDQLKRLMQNPPADDGTALLEGALQLSQRVARGMAEAGQRVRLISQDLVPIEVDPQGLRSALEKMTARTCELHGVACDLCCETAMELHDTFIATHLYRIAQEAVNNARKHAEAGHIFVRLENVGENLTLSVLDDGVGIDNKQRSQGIGLRIMRYRAGLIGADLKISRGEKGGTEVVCTLLLENRPAERKTERTAG